MSLDPIKDIEYLNECFFACRDTGKLFWKERPITHFKSLQYYQLWNSRFSTKEAGYLSGSYYKVCLNSKEYKVHNILFMLYTGNSSINIVDHIDGDTTNNLANNLRSVTKTENAKNRKLNANTSTGFKGVHKRYGKFTARIAVDGNRIFLGDFKTAEEAGEAYQKASIIYHKDFRRIV